MRGTWQNSALVQARQIVREYERQQASDAWPTADDRDAHARPGQGSAAIAGRRRERQ
jgi:hypothetical protein